ncbi:hypothetical protein [Pedobacter westerhofensis]|uniref:hypothetical protein n=1 Tax=Pedobacter westerhofensis TaxID=425512 RepID=UPI00115B135E|nr:hypothetical protein [Pedobacter westerhofensis]
MICSSTFIMTMFGMIMSLIVFTGMSTGMNPSLLLVMPIIEAHVSSNSTSEAYYRIQKEYKS